MTNFLAQSSTQQDILILLASEHRSIEQHIDVLEAADDPIAVASCFRELYKVLSLHHYGKTLVFYPAMREYEQTAAHLEAAEEELSSIKTLLEQLRQLLPNPIAFQAKLDELKESVMGHIEEEENEIFATVRACMTEQELRQLAQELKNIQTKIAPKLEARLKSQIFGREA